MNSKQFAAKIKAKYPEYSDIPDEDLVSRVKAKYPEYQTVFSDNEGKNQELSILNKNPIPVITPAANAIGKIITGKSDDEVKRPYKNIREFGADLADLAPFFVPEAKGAGLLAKSGIQGLTNAASSGTSSLLRGKGVVPSLKDAGSAGLAAAGVTGVLGKGAPLVKKGLSNIKEPVSESISSIGSFLSSIPKDIYKRAVDKGLEGNTIFNRSVNQDKELLSTLYKRMGEGLNYLKSESGKQIGAEKEALKKMGRFVPEFDSKELISKIDDLVDKSRASGGESAYTPDGLNAIQKIRESFIKGNIPIDDANLIKNKINSGVYSNRGTTPIIDPKGQDEAALQAIGAYIKEQVANKAPALNEVNEEFARKRALVSQISNKTSDFRQGPKTFKGAVRSDDALGELLEQADEMLPQKLKTNSDLKDLIARDLFRKITPGQGGGSGTSEGSANNLRVAVTNNLPRLMGVLGVGATQGLVPAAMLGTSFSPAVHKLGIKGLGSTVRGGEKLLSNMENPAFQKYAASTAAKMIPKSQPDDSTNPAWLEAIKRLRGIQ